MAEAGILIAHGSLQKAKQQTKLHRNKIKSTNNILKFHLGKDLKKCYICTHLRVCLFSSVKKKCKA